MNGWVTIGTKLDKKQLEQDIKNAEKELQKYNSESERLTKQKVQIEFDNEKFEDIIGKYDELADKERVLMKQAKEIDPYHDLASGKNLSNEEIVSRQGKYQKTNKEIESIREQIAGMEKEYSKAYNSLSANEFKLQNIDNILQQNKQKEEEITKSVENRKKQLAGVNVEIKKAQSINKIKSSISEIGSGMSGLVKTAIKYSLAIFGIRTAVNFLRNSISTLSQYDEQIATDLEYIRFALAMTLKPVVEWLIQAMYKVLSLIAGIIYAIFKVNIFANATSDAFNRTKSALGGANQSAKELRKTLAGFDEMNILQENGGVASGGGGGGIKVPSMNLSDMLQPISLKDIEKWFDDMEIKLKDAFRKFKKKILKAMKDLGFGEDFIEAMGLNLQGIEDVFSGTIDIFKGTMRIIKGALKGDKKEIEKGIEQFLTGFKERFTGWGEIILSILGMILIALKRAIWVLFIKPIIDKANEIKEKLQPFLDLFKLAFEVTFANIKNKCVEKVNDIVRKFEEGVNKIKDFFKYLPQNINAKLNEIVQKLSYFGTHAGDVIGAMFKKAVNAVIARAQNVLNSPISSINSLISKVNKVTGANISRLSYISLPRLAKGGIINQPGRGVMVGSAIAGESGREGVIPLTDSQQMALLGEAIGKYITINASITNTMNGRVISRELQKINNENDFAFNR